MTIQIKERSKELPIQTSNGWAMLPVVLMMLLQFIPCLVLFIRNASGTTFLLLMLPSLLTLILGFVMCAGFFTLQPNEACTVVLFGKYRGTERADGFHWTNPLAKKLKISLRSRNLNGEKLKVNDRKGNPIEIAAVVVWRVEDAAQAVFDVDDFTHYVEVQSESAVRHLATSYAYDHGEENETTLRGGGEEVQAALLQELQERLGRAGVLAEEARITHLAYAPEIASAMLRRQQAEAVIAARKLIVHGAVGMVEMALTELSEKKMVVLDDERKAAMVSNLLVVLCGDKDVSPVVNTGTLYN